MFYTVKSTNPPFTTNRLERCTASVGDSVMVSDKELAKELIRRGCICDPSESVAKPVEQASKTLNAIEEATAIKGKLILDKWAEDEHGIKLNRRYTLANMKKQFAELYEKKMSDIQVSNKAIFSGVENK